MILGHFQARALPSAGVMPWFQTMVCNLDQGEKCQKHATPSEFPGQLTEWPDWFEPHHGQNSTDDQGFYEGDDFPSLQECLSADPNDFPDECIWIINEAFNRIRKYICPGYIRPPLNEEEDLRQAKLLATVIKAGFVDLGVKLILFKLSFNYRKLLAKNPPSGL